VDNVKFFKRILKQDGTPEAGIAGRRAGLAPRRAGAGVLLAAAAVGGHAGTASEPLSSGVVPESFVYKTTDRGPLHVQVIKPAGPAPAGGRPCVLFFHGGGWRRGSANQFVPFSTLLARHGVIGMSAEYRLLGPDEDAVPREAIQDARSAMRWARQNAEKFGCDGRRIGAGGGSAGGTLALLTAMPVPADDPKDDLHVDPRPAALVVFNAPLDLDDYPSRVPLAERRRYAPYYQLDRNLPPTLIMQGTKDHTVPMEQVTRFCDKARMLGARDVTVVPFEGRNHGFFNKGKGQPGDFDAAAGHMLDFLRRLGWIAA